MLDMSPDPGIESFLSAERERITLECNEVNYSDIGEDELNDKGEQEVRFGVDDAEVDEIIATILELATRSLGESSSLV